MQMKFDFKGIWVEWTQWRFYCTGYRFIRAYFWSLLAWGVPKSGGGIGSGGVCSLCRARTEGCCWGPAGGEVKEEEYISLESSARPISKSWNWRLSLRNHPCANLTSCGLILKFWSRKPPADLPLCWLNLLWTQIRVLEQKTSCRLTSECWGRKDGPFPAVECGLLSMGVGCPGQVPGSSSSWPMQRAGTWSLPECPANKRRM